MTSDLPEGHNAMIAVLTGHVTVNGEQPAGEAEIVRLNALAPKCDPRGWRFILLVLTGEPIDEPVVGHGPFVMNSQPRSARQSTTTTPAGSARSRREIRRSWAR